MTRFASPHGRVPLLIAAAFLLLLLILIVAAPDAITARQPRAGASAASLEPFASDAELKRFLLAERARQKRRAAANASEDMSIIVSGTRAASPSITNNQESGVDEGDIVKLSGDILVILRRGRIFTVSIAGGGMRPVDSIDAFPPGVDASRDWYDEMLVSGDRIAIIGYSSDRGGTEISRFQLSRDGHLRFVDAYDLRSNDYYSSRNYASRLIGNRLIFYTPLDLDWDRYPLETLPAIRRWRGSTDGAFRRIAGARQVYIPPRFRNGGGIDIDTLHTVTSCDLTAPVLDCRATGVLGPWSRSFYVSAGAIYIWMSGAVKRRGEEEGARSLVYRLPLDGSAPAAVAARGTPVDQFSFREDKRARMLDVLVRSERGGDAMWRAEVTSGEVALLSLPLAGFGDGSAEVPLSRYRSLPAASEDDWSFHNRFVGSYLLYGSGEFGKNEKPSLVAVPVRGGPVARLPLTHPVERIEPLGADALVVGGDETSLGFTTIELGARPSVGPVYTRRGASEGESRSHAFFYHADEGSPSGASGMLGLPIRREAAETYESLFSNSAAMLFIRRADRRLSPAGELEPRLDGVADDHCVASCTDWYGNARPIFIGGRVFALLGYELIEGRMRDGRMRELGRVSFASARRRG